MHFIQQESSLRAEMSATQWKEDSKSDRCNGIKWISEMRANVVTACGCVSFVYVYVKNHNVIYMLARARTHNVNFIFTLCPFIHCGLRFSLLANSHRAIEHTHSNFIT